MNRKKTKHAPKGVQSCLRSSTRRIVQGAYPLMLLSERSAWNSGRSGPSSAMQAVDETTPVLHWRRQSNHAVLRMRGEVVTDVSNPDIKPKVVRYKASHLNHFGVFDCRMFRNTMFNSRQVCDQ